MISRFLFGKANCDQAAGRFSAALAGYRSARAVAVAAADRQSELLLSIALYNLSGFMGDETNKLRYLEQVTQIRPSSLDTDNRYRVLYLLGVAASEKGESKNAVRYLREGIQQAIDRGDPAGTGLGWSYLGKHYLRVRDFTSADRSLTEALRIRKLQVRRYVADSFLDLARLRIAMGDATEARVFADAAITAAPKAARTFPRHWAYYYRGVAEVALHDPAAAFADFQTALQYGRAWRGAVVPTDSARNASSVYLQRIYDDYIATGMRLQAPAIQMFEAAEENRALAFREKLLSQAKLPDTYWEILTHLRNAELQRMENPAQKDSPNIARLQLQLAELEAETGLPQPSTPVPNRGIERENIPPDKSLPRYSRCLAPGQALLAFHLGEKESFVWAFTRKTFEVQILPARAVLENLIRELRSSIESNSPDSSRRSHHLYSRLFGRLSPAAQAQPEWLLVLDDVLFQTPFAALVTDKPDVGTPSYLVARHSLRIVPSASMLTSPRSPVVPSNSFLAIGDPIFNTADPRWTQPGNPERKVSLFAFAASPGPLELPRLPGSAAEIRACAKSWQDRRTTVLQGETVNRNRILAELQKDPEIVHFATHVVRNPSLADSAYLSIGLDTSGRPDFLTPGELSNRHYKLGIVTMSACASGEGRSDRGAGLFGLTRAWLLAGAEGVVAAHWPVPDDSGMLFERFYSRLHTAGRKDAAHAAEALRSAQLEMLRSESWRAEPRYWASFFVIGKD